MTQATRLRGPVAPPAAFPGMSSWRKKLFLTMADNAANPARYFGLPDDCTVTIGARVDL